MKTLDNTIRYYELLMSYDKPASYQKTALLKGYYFEFYNNNEEDWIQIHLESQEFTSREEGKKIFYDFYHPFMDELNKRCIFLTDEKTKEKIGTATVSLLKEKQHGYDAVIDWFAIKKSYQGKHLSKAMLMRTIQLAHELKHDKILLHTQTTTPVAAKVYLDCGFKPLNKEEKTGWGILRSLINHEALSEFDAVKQDQIYDLRNLEIERQLKNLYQSDEFNYSIRDRNGMHQVYTYYQGISYEYEYFETGNLINLKQRIK